MKNSETNSIFFVKTGSYLLHAVNRLMKILPAALLMVSAVTWAAPAPVQNPKAAVNEELCKAVEKGDLNAANAALSKGAYINATTEYKYTEKTTSLMIAADKGDVKMTKLLMGDNVKKDRSLVNVTDRNGRTPLILAARNGHIEVVKLLLAVMQNDPRGPAAGINLRDRNGFSALRWTKHLWDKPNMKEIGILLKDAGGKE